MCKYPLVVLILLLYGITYGARLCTHANTIAHVPQPELILWAWERPEDLRFIDNKKVGVAVFSQLITINGKQIRVRPRQQPVLMPDGTYVISVTRIESDRRSNAIPDRAILDRVVEALIKDAAKAPMIQIDFDARKNEREFYLELLRKVRARLPKEKKISVTALASWAVYDPWIPAKDGLVDEVVPMFFQMGKTGNETLAKLMRLEKLPYRDAVAVSVSEAGSAKLVESWRRSHEPIAVLYVFNSAKWTPSTFRMVP